MRIMHLFLWSVAILLNSCGSRGDDARGVASEQYPKTVLKTPKLIIEQVSPQAYVHTSYLQTNDHGNVPCNGMIVVNGDEAVVFDATTDDTSSATLLEWISDHLKAKPLALVATHFHNDCLGGARAFEAAGVPVLGSNRTIAAAAEHGAFVPRSGFDSVVDLSINGTIVKAIYFGEGHTKDNVVAYFDQDKVLFGGCLIKELQADKGFLGDANVIAWPGTVSKIKNAFPDVELVVPGHGATGGSELLDYTIDLFSGTDKPMPDTP